MLFVVRPLYFLGRTYMWVMGGQVLCSMMMIFDDNDEEEEEEEGHVR